MSSVVRVDEVLPAGAAPTSPRAHVGVVAPLNFPDMTEEIAVLVRELVGVTLKTLRELDATFELLDPSAELNGELVPTGCDGVMLLGGGDIDPSCFMEPTGQMPGMYGVDLRADQQSFEMIAQAEDKNLPVLGICRGHQLINVHRGGTLILDVPDPDHIHHGGPDAPIFVNDTINLLPDTRVWDIFGTEQLTVCSAHHQAVDELGTGLVVSSRAADDTIEAIEDPGRWIVGVQWHPERAAANAEDRRRLFDAFIVACESRRLQQASAALA